MKLTDRKQSLEQVIKAIKQKNIVIIQGLRRIGKTLVMNSVKKENMFNDYVKIDFTVGFFGQNDNQVAKNLVERVQKEQTIKFIILVDEFQDLQNWSSFFMTLHRFSNVKVIATGSVSANLDLVNNTEGGRFDYIYMMPLSFNEYKSIDTSALALSDEELFNKFATFGSYPEQEFTYDLVQYKKQVSENIIEKIKNVTLLKNASIEDPQQVNNVLMYLIENVGNSTSDNSISKKLNIDVRTVKKILSFLKMTFIIHEVANSYLSKGKAAQNNKKYYLTDHTFYLFVKQSSFKDLEGNYKSFIFENIIINEVKKFFSRYEVETRFEIDRENSIDYDLVTLKDDQKKYFEIKYSESKNSLSKSQKKLKDPKNVIYLGETATVEDIQYINYIEFIKEVNKWI